MSNIKDDFEDAYNDYRGQSDSKQKYILAGITFVVGLLVGVVVML